MNWKKVWASSVGLGMIVVACESGSPWEPTAQNVESLKLSSAISSSVAISSSANANSSVATSSSAIANSSATTGTSSSSNASLSSLGNSSSSLSSSSLLSSSSSSSSSSSLATSSGAISSSSSTTNGTCTAPSWVAKTYAQSEQVKGNDGKCYSCENTAYCAAYGPETNAWKQWTVVP